VAIISNFRFTISLVGLRQSVHRPSRKVLPAGDLKARRWQGWGKTKIKGL